jgi:hypothetical protein
MWGYGFNNGGWGWGGMILMMIFWAVVIGLIILLLRWIFLGIFLHNKNVNKNTINITNEIKNAPVQTTSGGPEGNFCGHCGTEVKGNLKYCIKCGKPME